MNYLCELHYLLTRNFSFPTTLYVNISIPILGIRAFNRDTSTLASLTRATCNRDIST